VTAVLLTQKQRIVRPFCAGSCAQWARLTVCGRHLPVGCLLQQAPGQRHLDSPASGATGGVQVPLHLHSNPCRAPTCKHSTAQQQHTCKPAVAGAEGRCRKLFLQRGCGVWRVPSLDPCTSCWNYEHTSFSMITPEGYRDTHPAEGTSPVGPVDCVGTPGGTVSQFIMGGPPFLQPQQHTWRGSIHPFGMALSRCMQCIHVALNTSSIL
jgi:hypothetical protein